MLGIWLNAADTMVTATIMPSVARDLGGYAWFGWAVAVYLTGSILAGASAGQLSRRMGLRTAMAGSAAIYAAGCALSAWAPSIDLFLVGRALQGIGSGWIVGFCYVAIGVVFPERLWALMFGAGAGVWGVASLLGPLVGGLFAAAGHWRWAFWMFSVQGLLFAVACFPLLAAARDDRDPARPLAWRTLGLLAVAILAVAAADVVVSPAMAAVLAIVGLALLAIAGRVNARPSERLLPMDAARPLTTVGAGYGMILAMSAATAAFGVYGAAILQSSYGLSPLFAGYVVTADALGWTIAALLVSAQPDRRHDRFIRAGATVIVLGLVILAASIGGGRIGAVIVGAAMMGAGFGLAWSFLSQRIMALLGERDRAVGASAIPTTQLIGGAVGAAAAGAVANILGLAHHFTPARAAAAAPLLFWACVPVALLGWLAAMRLTRAVRPA
ncbi:MAG: MFS transporter [Caulobacteraceae bacterium]